MLTLQNFASRHARDPRFNAWLAAARPLSNLPSINGILRLDMLETGRKKPVVDKPAAGRPNGQPIAMPVRSVNGSNVVPFRFAGNNALQLDNEEDDEIIELGVPLGGGSELVDDGVDDLPMDDPPDPDMYDPTCFTIGQHAAPLSGPMSFDKQILRRHAAVLGGSGSGKTTLALSLIENLLLRDVPVVLIDRKGDLASYANPEVWRSNDEESADRRGRREELAQKIDVAVYTPGRTSGRPINITLLPNGIAELPDHEQQLLANVSAAAIGEMLHLRHSATHQRMSGILSVALKVLGSKSRSEVRLGDLIHLLEEDDEQLIELTQRMDPSGRARRDLMAQLDSLRHRNAALFEGHGESLRMESLLGLGQFSKPGRTRLSIIYTGFLGDNENVLFWVSQFLSEALRFSQRNPNEHLQAVIMFDEADLYIPANSKPATKEPLESLLKRARSAGIGLILATQSPGDLDYRSRDQITSWFIGRVREDTALRKLRAAFQTESGLDPSRVLPNQTVGEFHLIQEGKVRPLKSRRSLISAEQVPFDRIEQLALETRKQEVQQLKLEF